MLDSLDGYQSSLVLTRASSLVIPLLSIGLGLRPPPRDLLYC